MAKLILRCNYMKGAPPAHLSHYVRYVGTRSGAEFVDNGKGLMPATVRQKRLIEQLGKDIPDSINMLEYADYLAVPNRKNAGEFITQALEYNLDIVAKRENYIDYLGKRPRAERMGQHALFTDAGAPVVLAQVQKEVSEHKGIIWTNVISLKREDAARLGYDSAERWMELLRSKKAMLSKNLKIDSRNLRWYAAFHNENHHPHVHLMVYSADEREGYLSAKGIEAMRSDLAHDIFRQDFAQIYDERNRSRQVLKDEAGAKLQALVEQMNAGVVNSAQLESDLLRLAGKLREIKGRKQYGYMQKEDKQLVDRIVDELSREPSVAAAYNEWYRQWCEILKTYKDTIPDAPPLSEQETFKSIKNVVIAEALKLGDFVVSEINNNDDVPILAAPEAEPELVHEPDVVADDIFALNHTSEFGVMSPMSAATNLLWTLARLFESQADELAAYRARGESKAMSREKRKKIAMGHAADDREPEQKY